MPSNPTHTGLTAQGWNWSLSDAKSYVADYGVLDIGQMYITDDGKTRAVIILEEGRLSPRLGLGINGSVVVDWGDDSETTTMTGSNINTVKYSTHNYANAGEYTISIAVTGKAQIFGSDSYTYLLSRNSTANNNKVYSNCIKEVYVGTNIQFGNYAFYNCYSITCITIPNDFVITGNGVFSGCSVFIIILPTSVTSIEFDTFLGCKDIENIIIPNSVTSIKDGSFGGCYSLQNIIIPNSVTSIGSNVFSNCLYVKFIKIPNSVTSIGSNNFAGCLSIKNVFISDSLSSLPSTFMANCFTAINITIPNSITSIGSSAFSNNYGLGFIKFESTTPPTVANSNVWNNLPTDCKILVPQGTLETYKAATNYPNPSSYTYEEYTE